MAHVCPLASDLCARDVIPGPALPAALRPDREVFMRSLPGPTPAQMDKSTTVKCQCNAVLYTLQPGERLATQADRRAGSTAAGKPVTCSNCG